MSDTKRNITPLRGKRRPSRSSAVGRISRWIGISVFALILIVIVFIGGFTLWLTPQHLTEIINREASENLNADVKVYNARFTLWSTFPHFCLEMDSVRIMSRSLDRLDPKIMSQLPANAKYLASASKVRGGLNMMRLISGKIYLRNLEVDSIDLNLVAATDSIANYNIFPTSESSGKIPYITANKVKLNSPKQLRFFSRVTNSLINIDLKRASIVREPEHNNDYRMNIAGGINATVNKFRLLRNFPFSLNGDVALKFNPFAIAVSNYSIALGNTKGTLDMQLNAGEEMKINNLSYRLADFNVETLLGYLPTNILPALRSMHADIILNASAKLTTPYRFSASELPSVEVDVNVADGDVAYSFGGSNTYSFRHVGAGGKLVFDGKDISNSYFDIPAFKILGEGLDFNISARVANLINSPQASFNVSGNADAAKIGKSISELSAFGLKGSVATSLSGNMDIPSLSNGVLKNVDIKGDVALSDFGFSYPKIKFNSGGKSLKLNFDGKLASVNGNNIKGAKLLLDLLADGIKIDNEGMNIDISGLEIHNGVGIKTKNGINSLVENIPFDVDLGTAKLHILNKREATDVLMNGMKLQGTIAAAPAKGKLISASMKLTGNGIRGMLEGSTLDLKGISTVLQGKKLAKTYKPEEFKRPGGWDADSVAMDMFPHTPKYLRANISDTTRNLISGWDVYAGVKIAEGLLQTPAFPVNNRFKDFYAEASLDSLRVHRMHLTSQSTAMDISAKVNNLRQFLCSKDVAPLYVVLNADLDTVQINQLAGAYERGVKLTKGNATPSAATMARQLAADTTALLIPRNLIADIHATAKMTQYMNLQLEDLAADVDIHDGDADVKKLNISSDFGAIGLGFKMNTDNLEDMGLAFNGGIKEVNVVNFFKNFHKLLLMMPQMKNLSGVLSAGINARMGYFPNMYVDVPSVNADINVEGRGLTVHQDPFIRKITKMLMIRNSNDIHIKNMNVHASVHDDLLMLYPFDFEFDRYLLEMEGVNNFDGDMYYHVGVKKSPVPIPFGINIKGNFSDPQVRFGGEMYKVNQGAEVTRSIMERHEVNMVRIARKYLKEFVSKAAQSDTTPESAYIFK